MKKISDWAKVLLPLVGSGMILHYLFLWHERRHAVALHKEVYHKPHNTKEENAMIAQCLYQSDPKNLASMGRQRLACQRAARKLQWGVQKERISETNEPVPLLMRPAVKEILQDAEQHRFDVLLIGNRDSLCCDAADMESFLTVLNSFNIHIFAGGQGSWVEPNGRHYAPLPRLPWQEDDVAEVPQ